MAILCIDMFKKVEKARGSKTNRLLFPIVIGCMYTWKLLKISIEFRS